MTFKHLTTAAALALASLAAHADNWPCEVVLCLANPQGPTAVSECVPPIKKLWSHLAKGRSFPFCEMNSGGASGNSARHNWLNGENCPPQYVYWVGEGMTPQCTYSGAIAIKIDSRPYNTTYWNGSSTLTHNISASAKDAPGASTKYDQDYAVWKAQQDALKAQQEMWGQGS